MRPVSSMNWPTHSGQQNALRAGITRSSAVRFAGVLAGGTDARDGSRLSVCRSRNLARGHRQPGGLCGRLAARSCAVIGSFWFTRPPRRSVRPISFSVATHAAPIKSSASPRYRAGSPYRHFRFAPASPPLRPAGIKKAISSDTAASSKPAMASVRHGPYTDCKLHLRAVAQQLGGHALEHSFAKEIFVLRCRLLTNCGYFAGYGTSGAERTLASPSPSGGEIGPVHTDRKDLNEEDYGHQVGRPCASEFGHKGDPSGPKVAGVAGGPKHRLGARPAHGANSYTQRAPRSERGKLSFP